MLSIVSSLCLQCQWLAWLANAWWQVSQSTSPVTAPAKKHLMLTGTDAGLIWILPPSDE
jgi:hypothetical protein